MCMNTFTVLISAISRTLKQLWLQANLSKDSLLPLYQVSPSPLSQRATADRALHAHLAIAYCPFDMQGSLGEWESFDSTCLEKPCSMAVDPPGIEAQASHLDHLFGRCDTNNWREIYEFSLFPTSTNWRWSLEWGVKCSCSLAQGYLSHRWRCLKTTHILPKTLTILPDSQTSAMAREWKWCSRCSQSGFHNKYCSLHVSMCACMYVSMFMLQ